MALILSPVVYVESFFFPNEIIFHYRGNFGSGYDLFHTAVLSKKRCRCFSKDKSNFLNFNSRTEKKTGKWLSETYLHFLTPLRSNNVERC